MLTAAQIKQAKPKEKGYRLADSGGLFLWVTPAGGKYWRIKFRWQQKELLLSVGSLSDVSLVQAREHLQLVKRQLAKGLDPRIHKTADSKISFESVAREWMAKQENVWSASHAKSVLQRSEKHLFPHVGDIAINEIRPKHILEITDSLERQGIFEQAHRVRNIADQVFRYANARELCESNPAASIKGSLTPKKPKHFAAVLDPKLLGKLLRDCDVYSGSFAVRQALRLTPHLFVRPGMLRHMEWVDLDFNKSTWLIPGAKMKMSEDLIVPLSRQAKAMIEEMEFFSGKGRYVFPCGTQIPKKTPFELHKPMSENAVNLAYRKMGYGKDVVTGHGFRATARTLLDEVLNVRVDYIEQQLGHVVKDTLGRAYNRTKHLDGRADMMQAWSDYLDSLKNG